jgi:hypothetical protein
MEEVFLEIAPSRSVINQSLPAQSITVYSTYKLAAADPGITTEDGRE